MHDEDASVIQQKHLQSQQIQAEENSEKSSSPFTLEDVKVEKIYDENASDIQKKLSQLPQIQQKTNSEKSSLALPAKDLIVEEMFDKKASFLQRTIERSSEPKESSILGIKSNLDMRFQMRRNLSTFFTSCLQNPENAVQNKLNLFQFFTNINSKSSRKYQSPVFHVANTKNLTLQLEVVKRFSCFEKMTSQKLGNGYEKKIESQLEIKTNNNMNLLTVSKSRFVKTTDNIINVTDEETKTTAALSGEIVKETKESLNTTWSGFILKANIGKFFVTAQNLFDSARDISGLLPNTLKVIGKIDPEKFWNYVWEIKKYSMKEILIVKFETTNDDEKKMLNDLCSYLENRNRLGVLDTAQSPGIKDFYVLPFYEDTKLPSFLPHFERYDFKKDQGSLLGVIIAHECKKRMTDEMFPSPSSKNKNRENSV